MISSIKITFLTTTNQDSDLMTLTYITLLPLHITFWVLSMITLCWKFVVFLNNRCQLIGNEYVFATWVGRTTIDVSRKLFQTVTRSRQTWTRKGQQFLLKLGQIFTNVKLGHFVWWIRKCYFSHIVQSDNVLVFVTFANFLF